MATTTSDIQQSGGDYATLSAWEADRDGLSGANDTEVASISGSWTVDDSTPFTIAGFAAGVTIDIHATGSSKHGAFTSASPSHYRLRCSSGGHCITASDENINITGIEVRQGSSTNSDECIRVPLNGQTVNIDDCLFWNNTTQSDQDCVYAGNSGNNTTVNITQCILWSSARSGCAVEYANTGTHTGNVVNVNSCTFFNHNTANDPVGNGIRAHLWSGDSATINIMNSVFADNANGPSVENTRSVLATWDIHRSVAFDAELSNVDSGADNVLENYSATDNTSPGAGDWMMFNDITTSPYDLRLTDDADNDIQDVHAVASGAGMTIPSEDIVGTTRPDNTNYEMGAFEIVSGGAALAIPIVMQEYRRRRTA